MNQLPPDLSPAAATWLRLQCTIAASRITQPLNAALCEQEGFINGLLVVVAQLVPAVLEAVPEVATRLAPAWREAAERYEALSAGAVPATGDEALAQLEARQLLYRACEQRGLWSVGAVRCAPRHLKRRRTAH